jgi:hypothetical protein
LHEQVVSEGQIMLTNAKLGEQYSLVVLGAHWQRRSLLN